MPTRDITLQEIQVGDKIEITSHAGVVWQDFVVGFSLGGLLMRSGFCLQPTQGSEYRLLFRPSAAQVGDLISGPQVFELPLGSQVIRNHMRYLPECVWIVTKNGDGTKLIHRADSTLKTQYTLTPENNYRIVFLPEYDRA
jgi:hypothetical protein